MNKDNFYVAFQIPMIKMGTNKIDMADRYGDLHVYWKDTGRVESLEHVTYNQLCEAHQHQLDGGRISLIPETPDGVYACPWIDSFLWEHMGSILDNLGIYIRGQYSVIDSQSSGSMISGVDYLGNTYHKNIRDHHSLIIRDYSGASYIGGLTADEFHDICEKYNNMSSDDELFKKYGKPFISFICGPLSNLQYWKSTSINMIAKDIWEYYCGCLDRKDIAHEILDDNKDRSLPQEIVLQKYDEDPSVFKDNVDALVDEVNHNYDLFQTKLKAMGFELKKIAKDEKPSEMDELMSTCEYLRKNIAVSFVKIPETRGDYKITLCNINDPSGIIYKCHDEITVKSVRENLNPESKGSRFYKLFSTMKDMYADLKCEYIPATDIMEYISSEYNRTIMCPAQLPVATRQIKLDLFKIALNAFPVTYNGKDDLEFTINLYHTDTGAYYITILPGQLFTASQVLEYNKSLQDYRDMIHDPIRSQKTKIFETRILDLLRTVSEDFSMTDVMEIIYGAYAISVNHRIKNW